ncbi:ABC transporter permease [Streptacidiphilus jiangxiensis]|uniref:Putative ABC transport system permease protein n=1 Tax=Streptacidiphilus jiangxiensis TaxID=235985 RepID=A0A1H7SJD7_STRJI|nr:FtsX-like permease family protein [Streptacidiphilus jiangxiensis]SEL72643.1 putative ABC transport system permease protein [Streptacidiphilus jiangxiensis]
MFVALRDIRFAKGRFALMGAVVTLITTLVVFLYGLTGGLASAASSSIAELPTQSVVFGAPQGAAPEVSFSNSAISPQQEQAFRSAPGIGKVEPLGVAMSRLTGAGSATSVSVFGAPADLLPPLVSGTAPQNGQIAVGQKVADDSRIKVGDQVSVGGQTLTVSGITTDRSYAHAASVWTTPDTWSQATGAKEPNALAVDPGSADVAALDKAQNTDTVSRSDALAGIDGYSAEQGSLQMIQGFLFAVSALVVGAFFTVWTVQRKPDIAVLKAVGASSAYLVRDALAQALAMLVVGALSGAAIGFLGGALLGGTGLPFTLGAATIAVPVVVMVLLGLAGAALAVRRITSVDPLTALGANR